MNDAYIWLHFIPKHHLYTRIVRMTAIPPYRILVVLAPIPPWEIQMDQSLYATTTCTRRRRCTPRGGPGCCDLWCLFKSLEIWVKKGLLIFLKWIGLAMDTQLQNYLFIWITSLSGGHKTGSNISSETHKQEMCQTFCFSILQFHKVAPMSTTDEKLDKSIASLGQIGHRVTILQIKNAEADNTTGSVVKCARLVNKHLPLPITIVLIVVPQNYDFIVHFMLINKKFTSLMWWFSYNERRHIQKKKKK